MIPAALRVVAPRVVGQLLVASVVAIVVTVRWPLPVFAALVPILYAVWCLWPRWRTGIDAAPLEAPAGQRVVITFDDGPTPGVTDRILDLLAAHGVQAIFFVLTAKAERNRALIRRIVDEGHLLGLHGEDHRAPFFRDEEELLRSLTRAKVTLAAIAGRPITLYRPSHGWKTRALVRAVGRAGLRLAFWDYGVWDTDAPSVTTLLRRLRAIPSATVALLHDGRGDDPCEPPHAPVLLSALSAWLIENSNKAM